MDKRKLGITLSCSIAVIAVAAIVLMLTLIIFVDGHFYPKSATALDLREQPLTAQSFDRITQALPDCYVLWNIPFQGGYLVSSETDLTVTTLTEEDVAALDYATALKTVDGTACTDYAQLAHLQQRHPNAKVLYTMTVSGQECDQDTRQLKLEGLTQEDAQKLPCLLKLDSLSITGCTDYALLTELQQAHPEWNLDYTVALGQEEFPWDSKDVRAVGAEYNQIVSALEIMPALENLNLVNPASQGGELVALRESYPQVNITWQVEIYGLTVNDDITELDLSGIQVESCEEVEALVACLPNLEKLIMSDCGIDSPTMAAFRERQRENYKVVWTVYLGKKCVVRTDETYFMPIKQGEYYFLDQYSEELKYCEDMVCIDLGHHKIHNIDFVAYMPHLKYLIIAHTEVQDVSPIVNCQELVYLEVDWSTIRSYEPIAQLKNLEDLNLNETFCNITPILSMTWLKNLWAPGRSYSIQQQLIEALPDTHLQLSNQNPPGEGWRNLPNYYAMRDYLGMYYMK